MPCPFLTRLPSTFVKNYAPALMKQYMDQCPIMSGHQARGLFTKSVTKDAPLAATCPFVKDEEAVVPSRQEVKRQAPQPQEVRDKTIVDKGNCS